MDQAACKVQSSDIFTSVQPPSAQLQRWLRALNPPLGIFCNAPSSSSYHSLVVCCTLVHTLQHPRLSAFHLSSNHSSCSSASPASLSARIHARSSSPPVMLHHIIARSILDDMTNSTCPEVNTEAINTASFFAEGWSWSVIGWAVAGGCTLVTCIVTIINVYRHCTSYWKP